MRGKRTYITWALVFGLCVLVYWLYWRIFAVHQGRDFGTYISYYVQLFAAQPADQMLMEFRTPGAPLFFGLLDALGGLGLVTVALCLLFALGHTLVFVTVARLWNRIVAWLWLTVVMCLSAYNWAWHTVASESPYCFAVLLLTWAALRAMERPTRARWCVCGLLVFLGVMIRPGSQLFAILCLAPLLLGELAWRRRLELAAAFVLPLAVLLLVYAGTNYARYGDFVVARGGNALIPGYRVFILDHLMRPDRGPASARLARAVAEDLLPRPLYRRYGIDLDVFFRSGDSAMYNDLIALSDRFFGWDSDYAVLRDAAWEAVRAEPWTYLKSIGRTLWVVFSTSEHEIYAKTRENWPDSGLRDRHAAGLRQAGLAVPDYGDLLPHAAVHWILSGSGRLHPDPATVAAFRARTQAIAARYPTQDQALAGKPRLVAFWYRLSKVTAPMYLPFCLGLVSFFRRDRRSLAVSALFVTFSLTILATFCGTNTVFQFRNTFDPFFILAGLHGLVILLGSIGRLRPKAVTAGAGSGSRR
jgi:hypothetical protein